MKQQYEISGQTIDNKIIVKGLFRLINQEEISIDNLLEMCYDKTYYSRLD